jgi:cytochrome c556
MSRTARVSAALAAVFALLIPLSAQKALIPLAASTLADEPDRYYGERVTVTGAVERTFSTLAFSIDQEKTRAAEKDVLVLTRWLDSPVGLNAQVTVVGEVVKLDPDAIGSLKDFAAGLAQDVIAKYRGRPVLLATSVIGVAGIDLARRPPPPLSADEAAYAAVMKEVSGANSALRKALDASDAGIAREQAAVLKQAFTKTAGFWKTRGKSDAVSLADEARKLSETIERAAAGGKWEEVKTSAGSLGQTCQKCHTAYRERLDDGSYRIKQDPR